jgi:hypothetical protein
MTSDFAAVRAALRSLAGDKQIQIDNLHGWKQLNRIEEQYESACAQRDEAWANRDGWEKRALAAEGGWQRAQELKEQLEALRADSERVIAAWYGQPGMLKTSMGKLRQTLAASSPARKPS